MDFLSDLLADLTNVGASGSGRWRKAYFALAGLAGAVGGVSFAWSGPVFPDLGMAILGGAAGGLILAALLRGALLFLALLALVFAGLVGVEFLSGG